MFNVGDKVVYPMHGAGVIEAIEEKEILGKKSKYYIMRMPIGNMKVMVPMDNVQDVGLRRVVGNKDISKVMDILSNGGSEMSSNWNRRYKKNLEKIKSGNIFEVAEVVTNLMAREKRRAYPLGKENA